MILLSEYTEDDLKLAIQFELSRIDQQYELAKAMELFGKRGVFRK